MDGTVQLIEDLADLAVGRTTEVPVRRPVVDRSDADRHFETAEDNAAVDELPVPSGRNTLTKRFILKGGRFVFARQRAYNRAVLALVQQALDESGGLITVVEQERRRSAAAAVAIEASVREIGIAENRQLTELRDAADAREAGLLRTVEELHARVDDLAARTQELEVALATDLRGCIDDLRSELLLERHRRANLERELRAFRREFRSGSIGTEFESGGDQLSVVDSELFELYERFEQHFRPTGTALDDRFIEYLPNLENLRGGELHLFDIGTGRGDFLRVLRTAGLPARGIDLNPEAVDAAVANGLDVIHADAMAHLSSIDNESLGAVTAFHVVEHLEPEALVRLIDEIVRVLAPGGTVILETPNPTNLVVGAASFYHDPTHVRPVSPDYLAFLLRDRGLVDVQTRFLHPLPEFELPLQLVGGRGEAPLVNLLKDVQWALKGPQDYAVTATGPRRGS